MLSSLIQCPRKKKTISLVCDYGTKLQIGGFKYGLYFPFHIWDNPAHWLILFKMVKTTNQTIFGSIKPTKQCLKPVGGFMFIHIIYIYIYTHTYIPSGNQTWQLDNSQQKRSFYGKVIELNGGFSSKPGLKHVWLPELWHRNIFILIFNLSTWDITGNKGSNHIDHGYCYRI
jgi:hypothetical protein